MSPSMSDSTKPNSMPVWLSITSSKARFGGGSFSWTPGVHGEPTTAYEGDLLGDDGAGESRRPAGRKSGHRTGPRVEALAGRQVYMESRRQRTKATSSETTAQVKVEDQPAASLDTERAQDRVRKDVEEATRQQRDRFQTEYEQRWQQCMAEVEQERARWTAKTTRALGVQQEVLAAERASLQQLKNTEEHRRNQEASETQPLQQQFQDLRATVAALLHPNATIKSKSNAIGDPDSATQKSGATYAIKDDARDCSVYVPVKNLTEVALSQLRATLPEVKDEPRVKNAGESGFRQLNSGDSGLTKSVSGKKGSTRPESRKASARKAKEDSGSPPSDPGDGSASSSDDGDNSASRSSGSKDSLDNDEGPGTAASKTTKDGTTVWNFRSYINHNAVEKFNDTASKEDRVNSWERFTDMAAQGSWPDKMKIHQFRSRMPATIRDWYAQLPKSTRHNWKLLYTKFKKQYCRTT
ncbi:hypothetical protein PHMEG_00030757 [Phytophthora megakarya]|uniref:Eukaryotic/viral aspartic protease n=1 Tax=Phytophthora megakarya TaxID=4795 RepID=A0A225UZX4_9STRA|nr:hypothetical protein PHMEG_00030757 [Phytophthora megakarya]